VIYTFYNTHAHMRGSGTKLGNFIETA